MNKHLVSALVSAVVATTCVSAQAATIDVNLAGWETFSDDVGDPANTSVTLNLGAGASISGFSYLNLVYTTSGESWLSEFVLSVSNDSDVNQFLEWAPSLVDAGGTYGPQSGAWNGPTGVPGPFGEGAPFTVTDGLVFVTAYEAFDDDGLDATVTSGTLRITYTPGVSVIPEPSTYALMGIGLLGLGAAARRRS